MDRLDDFVIENLSRIAADQNYVDSLIFKHNNQAKGSLRGIEMKGSTSPMSAEIVKENLYKVVEAAKMKDLNERKNIIRKYINGINYSKNNIEVVLSYYDESHDSEGFLSRQAEHSAACVWVGANAGRRPQAQKAKTAGSTNPTVRYSNLVGLYPSPRTISIILPNTIHGCKKLNLRRRKR
jgi:hypothetical protein